MARIRIEWVPIQVYNLGLFGLDHLQLVFQPTGSPTSNQIDWFVMEGTRDEPDKHPYHTLGVLGANGRTTLGIANAVIEGQSARLPTEAELEADIGTPHSRGSRALPFTDPFSAWETMAYFGSEIDKQELPYIGSGFALTGLPTINSTSVIASLVHYAGLDVGNYLGVM